MSMIATASAYDLEFDLLGQESPFFRELAEKGEIHIDRSDAPPRPDGYLQRRQAGDTVVPTTISEPTSTSSSGGSTSAAASATVTSPQTSSAGESDTAIATDTATAVSQTAVTTSIGPSVTVVTTPLPSPFDTSLGSNFTSPSCPSFFATFLGNATFRACVPVSLLLQNSNSFFRAERSPTLLAQTLDAACGASLAICSPLTADLASELLDDAHCGQDYKLQNPLVMQAYAGLVAYEPVYRATCLKDAATGSYCFDDAITNATDQADAYVYYTALGIAMPTTARPTCSPCLRDTMRIFAGYAADAAQPLARTYLGGAGQIDAACGTAFVATDVKVGSVSDPNAAATTARVSGLAVAAAAVTLLLSAWVDVGDIVVQLFCPGLGGAGADCP
jgi:hypothetical protein